MSRSDRSVDGREQLAPHRVEVDGIPQPQRERRHDRLGVVAGPVEATVDKVLHAPPQGLKQGGEPHDADEHSHEQSGEDQVRVLTAMRKS
jgi:hypothetical protein